jgi:transposase
VKAALSATTVEADRHDARGIARIARTGWFEVVHVKRAGSQDLRMVLAARWHLLRQSLGQRPSRPDIAEDQAGDVDRIDRISKVGDGDVRAALFEAANVALRPSTHGLG